jgi:signal transduction histidine kinase
VDSSELLAVDDPRGASLRELRAAAEIASAFLGGDSPAGVYRLALERVGPLVGAAFGCVYLADAEGLLRIEAAWSWPAGWAAFLEDVRVRPGAGPTGRAVEEGSPVEVYDLFSDPALEDWWEAARELDFTSSVSLPLRIGGRVAGAVTLYFRTPERLDEADRSLLRLVADQLSAAAEKAHLIDDLRAANLRLREQNVELEARYREAEEARRLKSEFLANVSHELRTPLTAILGYTYLLREGMHGDLSPDQATAVEKIEGAGGRLQSLIDDLLDFTNLKLGRLTVEPERCDAAALARAAIAGVDGLAGAEVSVVLDAGETPVPVDTDPPKAQRVIRALLSNALKFTSRGTVTVRVRASDVPPLAVWEVIDTGIGIDPSHLETIFDEFRQVDGSATRRFGGMGMGLALARQLARALGGDVTVRSTPGLGSSFRLTLPLARRGDA